MKLVWFFGFRICSDCKCSVNASVTFPDGSIICYDCLKYKSIEV